mmetsp:Transcript_80028/g.208719  ORF Transcript_80028/g.208719 Transcript_80028/m.208719 type:complete len:205 (-) Transcript_80028:918-1532(-)
MKPASARRARPAGGAETKPKPIEQDKEARGAHASQQSSSKSSMPAMTSHSCGRAPSLQDRRMGMVGWSESKRTASMKVPFTLSTMLPLLPSSATSSSASTGSSSGMWEEAGGAVCCRRILLSEKPRNAGGSELPEKPVSLVASSPPGSDASGAAAGSSCAFCASGLPPPQSSPSRTLAGMPNIVLATSPSTEPRNSVGMLEKSP